VATERLEGVRSVALGIWIAAGSRLEPPRLGGISHFIEHLIFKGSARYPARQIAQIFDDLGAEPNASTSKEHTLVNARLLDDDLETAFEVIAEIVARPSFADIDQEREVVLEEVAMYEDSPPELIHDDLCEVVFDGHPLGRPGIGCHETLSTMDLQTVREYHRERYVNPGIVVAASGSVDHERLCALTAQHFDPDAGTSPARTERTIPVARHVARFTRKDTEQYHVCLGGPGPCRSDPQRWAVFVVDAILGGSWSSHLFQEVRERRGLAYSVYSYTSLYTDVGLTAVYFGSREEAVEEALLVILEALQDLEADMSEAAIDRAKNHLKGQLVLGMESPSARMQALGRSVLMEQPVLSVDEILERIDMVDRNAVVEAVRRYYDPDRWSTACIGPEPEPFQSVARGFEWEER